MKNSSLHLNLKLLSPRHCSTVQAAADGHGSEAEVGTAARDVPFPNTLSARTPFIITQALRTPAWTNAVLTEGPRMVRSLDRETTVG